MAKDADDDLSADAQAAVEAAEETARLIDEDVPDGAKDKNPEFFETVREKSLSIAETIRTRGTVSDKQREALDNMQAGVKKWIR
jgi:vacuolar-type H+-ATPase subunit H